MLALHTTACSSSAEVPGDAPPADAPPSATDAPPADAPPAPTDAPPAAADAPPDPTDAPPAADAPAAPTWPLLETAGFSAARLEVTPEHVIVLEEILTGFDAPAPGPRRVRSIDRRTLLDRTWAPAPSARIGDLALHPSGGLSLVVVDEAHGVNVVGLDASLVPIAATLIVDPLAPSAPGGVPGLRAGSVTSETVRIAALGEDVVVTVFTSVNAIVAYRMHRSGAAWTVIWSALVEPGVGLTPFIPIGGSFDTFGAIVAWYRPALATAPGGDIYVAAWMGQRRFEAHRAAFADDLRPLPSEAGFHDSDVVVTKISPAGERQWSRVIGTIHEDEPYALAAQDDRVIVVGRARQKPGFDNTQWDPWIGILDAAGAEVASRTLAFDRSAILLAVAVDGPNGIAIGGSDGWSQNPDGLSVLSFGWPLAARLDGAMAEPVRLALPSGARHNEVRSLRVTSEGIWFAGHEDGPLTHSGDGDRSQIRATGVVGLLPR